MLSETKFRFSFGLRPRRGKTKVILISLVLSFGVFSQSIDDGRAAVFGTTQNTHGSVVMNFINPNKEIRVEKTAIGTFLINPNFIVHPDPNVAQAEVILVRNKQVPNIMFGASMTAWPPGVNSGRSAGVYVTTNGGLNWFGWDTIHTPISIRGTDPAPVIDKNGTFIFTCIKDNTSYDLVGTFSTNSGQTWSVPYTIAPDIDKNMSGTDDIPSSPYYGRSFTAWTAWGLTTKPIEFSFTTNNGVSWSTPIQVNNSTPTTYSQGVDISCGTNGEVYLVWAAPIRNTIFTEDFDGFAKSTNGGVNWTVNENAFDANGIRGFLTTKGNIRVNSWPRMDVDKTGGPRNGWIYVVGCDTNLAPSGSDPDIIFHRSTNGGATWSQAIRVNQDPLNNGAIQFFPAITIDDGGGINIIYYDDRNVGGQLSQVYLSRSTDGGNTWVDVQVSDHPFTVQPVQGFTNGFMGDYIGVTYSGNRLWPIWMDNTSGLFQAWTTSVLTPVEPIANEIPVKFNLEQNYPNPFNPATKMRFALPKSSFVKLVIYDALGSEVVTLVNEKLKSGVYEVDWEASNYASGAYFYKLTAGDVTETKKMILVK